MGQSGRKSTLEVSMTLNINALLVRSIPLDHNLKRYFLSKYRHLVMHNGMEYANDKFKTLLYHCQSRLSGENSVPPGVRVNGWMRKLYGYLGSNPEWVLNFLKLYSWVGRLDRHKAAHRTASLLKEISSSAEIPKFISDYMEILNAPLWLKRTLYDVNRIEPAATFHRYAKHHTECEWIAYWKEAHNRWSIGKGRQTTLSAYSPFPEHYAQDGDLSYQRDFFLFLRHLTFNSDLAEDVREYLISLISHDIRPEIERQKYQEFIPETDGPLSLAYGEIHFIPKDGCDFRPIAVPNRFFQQGLAPVHNELVSVLRKFHDRDATYNQQRFNDVIQSRVNTRDRFIGSADLSAATDRLPRSWFDPMAERLGLHKESWSLFQTMSGGNWHINHGTEDWPNLIGSSWLVGQPLGTLPSFQVLGLTQHLILESLSLRAGYGHRPYRVLGDDVVIFSKRLWNVYMSELSRRNVKISRHKSYSGKFTQFAGYNFVKNGLPFLTPAHNLIYPNSLFDYQISTGIRIRWGNLPRMLQKGWSRKHYELVQEALVHPLGRGKYKGVPPHMSESLVAFFAELFAPEEDKAPDPELGLGFVQILGMPPVVVSVPEQKRDGLFTRYRRTKLPQWFRQKFRPYEVSYLLDLAKRANT